MKLRFLKSCKDKNTKEMYNIDDVHEFDEDRGKEILETGCAEVYEEELQNEPLNADEALEEGFTVNLHDLSKEKLMKIARKVNVATRGTKDEIIERILAAQAK